MKITIASLLREIQSIKKVAAPRPKNPTKLQNAVYDQKYLGIEQVAVSYVVDAMELFHELLDSTPESEDLETFANAHAERIKRDIKDGFELLKSLEYQIENKHKEIYAAVLKKLKKLGMKNIPSLTDIVFEGFDSEKPSNVNNARITSTLVFPAGKIRLQIEQTPQRKGYDLYVNGTDMRNPTGAVREIVELTGACGLPADPKVIAKIKDELAKAEVKSLEYERNHGYKPITMLKIKGLFAEYRGYDWPWFAFKGNLKMDNLSSVEDFDYSEKKTKQKSHKHFGNNPTIYHLKVQFKDPNALDKLISKLGSKAKRTPSLRELEQLKYSLTSSRDKLRETKPSQSFLDLSDMFRPVVKQVNDAIKQLKNPKPVKQTVPATKPSPKRVVQQQVKQKQAIPTEDILDSLGFWANTANKRYRGDGTYGREPEVSSSGKTFEISVRGLGNWDLDYDDYEAMEDPDPDFFIMDYDDQEEIGEDFESYMKGEDWWDSSRYELEFSTGEKEWSYFYVRVK